MPEFEFAIARGFDIEQTRKQLTEKARNDYQDLCQVIEHDAKIAELVVYALRSEPVWSPGFGVARGLQKRFRKEHPEDDTLVRDLRKAVWMEDKPNDTDKRKRREDNDHEGDKGTAETTRNPDGDDGSGEGSQESVSETIPGES